MALFLILEKEKRKTRQGRLHNGKLRIQEAKEREGDWEEKDHRLAGGSEESEK